MDKLVDDDESLLRWRMSIEEEVQNVVEEEVNNTSEPLLKAVVRTSYLHHLRKSLRKNLESSKQNNVCTIDENLVNKVIKGCSALIEEKALRSCMIAKLYQRTMAQMIKEVKKATDSGQLYSLLKEFAERQSKTFVTSYVDKEIQTEVDGSNIQDQIAQFLCQTQSLFQKMNHPTRNKSVESLPTDITDAVPIRIDPTQNLTHMNGVLDIENRCADNNVAAINAIMKKSRHRTNSIDITDTVPQYDDVHNSGNNVKRKYEEFSSFNVAHLDENCADVATRTSYDPTADVTSNMAITNKEDPFQMKLKSATFVEGVALWHHLDNELIEMSPSKRQKMDAKFVQLFGPDHAIDYYCLSEEEKLIVCRKRIAKHVVVDLTNHYVQKKIASKQLFKTMAKHITSILLGRSLYPDPDEIRKSVEEFFIEGRVINSEDDFYF